MWRLEQARTIRRAIGHPKCPHMSFYYNLLLSHIPFRDEQAVLPADGDYFVECVRQGIFTTTAELDRHIQAYAKYNLWTNAVLDKIRGDVDSFVAQAAAAALQLPTPTGDTQDHDSPEVYSAGAAAFETMQMEEGADPACEKELQAPTHTSGGRNRHSAAV